MKKIGILSMQNVNNFGSYWQARSLKEMLEEIGCDVSFLEIMPGRQIVDYTYHRKLTLQKLKRVPYYIYSYKRNKMYEFYKDKAFKYRDITDLEAVVIGSDEVFNCKQQSPWGFTTQLYGDVDCQNTFTYAASFGYTDYEFILEKGIENEIREALLKLSKISVRDENSRSIVYKLTGKESEIHLDPVLLNMNIVLNANSTKRLEKKYILIYSYDFRFKEKQYIEAVRSIAKKNKLQIIAVGFYQDWVDKNIIASPNEVIDLFKNAEYVVTDTFHGTIFSVKSKKRFVTIVRESNKQKLGYLLKTLSLQNHIAENFDQVETILKMEPDYNSLDRYLLEQRNCAINYLADALS